MGQPFDDTPDSRSNTDSLEHLTQNNCRDAGSIQPAVVTLYWYFIWAH